MVAGNIVYGLDGVESIHTVSVGTINPGFSSITLAIVIGRCSKAGRTPRAGIIDFRLEKMKRKERLTSQIIPGF
jgi:hypothetical protein